MRTFRRPAGVLVALALMSALTGCLSDDVTTTLAGQLLDGDGAAVADAVVFVPEDGVASTLATAAVHRQAGEGCQTPSEPVRASTCTDASGRYTLQVRTPLVGTLRLVFERLYWRSEVEVPLGVRVPGEPIDVDASFPSLEPSEELEAALRHALPTLDDWTLIAFPDEKAIAALQAWAVAPDADVEPIHLTLPILQPHGTTPTYVSWTAYHHDVRAPDVQDCAIDAVSLEDVDCQPVAGPSLTFQGMPVLAADEIRSLVIGETEKNLSDETLYQMSTIAVIGDELDATYFGQALAAPFTPSSLQGLRSVLDVHYDVETVERLLAENDVDYLLTNQIDLNLGIEDPELDLVDAQAATTAEVGRANHFLEDGVKYLRPVMVADSTVYDADTGERLVPAYFARVDAMANRQDLFFALAQLSANPVDAGVSLIAYPNAFAVRTQIAGYRRLTKNGQADFTFPSSDCGALGDGTLIDEYAERSRDRNTVDNEYWMWWTNTDRYPGSWGCAGGFGVIDATPRDGAVAWTSFRNYTLETVGQTFMHETGHLMNAVHSRAATSQRCTVLGIFPFGVTGPSMMGGTSDRNLRTNCFALTPTGTSTARNRTRVAEWLHANLAP